MGSLKRSPVRVFSLVLALVFLATIAIGNFSLIWAQEVKRGFSFSSEYTHVVVGKGKEIELDVKITNTGEREEDINLLVSGPEGWGARLEKSWPALEIQAVHLPPEKPDNSVTLKFKAKPPEEATPGDYRFTLQAATKDGKIKKSLELIVTYKAKAVPKAERVKLTAKNPGLKRASGEDFEFEIELKNELDEDRVFDLAAKIPSGWGAYCTPRWEKEKKISAVKVDAKGTETLRFVLVPPLDVPEGEYSVTFIARSGEDEGSIELKAVVTGTYKLKMQTEKEVLNIKATAGKEKRFTIYLWNEGSADITDIDFFSDKPKDWEVSFKPEKIPTLPPIIKELKPKKVEVTIKPKPKAIPGDYMVTLTASGKEARESLELRVTVGTPVTWGWAGIAIVVVVVAALIGIFVRLGRR